MNGKCHGILAALAAGILTAGWTGAAESSPLTPPKFEFAGQLVISTKNSCHGPYKDFALAPDGETTYPLELNFDGDTAAWIQTLENFSKALQGKDCGNKKWVTLTATLLLYKSGGGRMTLGKIAPSGEAVSAQTPVTLSGVVEEQKLESPPQPDSKGAESKRKESLGYQLKVGGETYKIARQVEPELKKYAGKSVTLRCYLGAEITKDALMATVVDKKEMRVDPAKFYALKPVKLVAKVVDVKEAKPEAAPAANAKKDRAGEAK